MENISFIAEVSGNHGGDYGRAEQILRAAASAGATHLKLQTYTPDSITLNLSSNEFRLDDTHELWPGKSLYSLYQSAQTPYEWHEPLFSLAKSLGMVPFSTPFDEEAVDFLESLGVELYKIASLEIVDTPLIERTAQTGKPMIISTGTATLDEVSEAVEAARSSGCKDLTLLVCTSDYPADPSLANLARIPFLANYFGCKVGLSDHTIGTHVAMAGIALGATVIEKHLTIDRNDGAVDSGFSATPEEFRNLVTQGQEVASAIGSESAWGLVEEGQSRRHRPSIIFVKEGKEGDLIDDLVKTLRPNIGLKPKYMPEILGKRLAKPAFPGEGLRLDHLS